jgi:hypothetical protein
MGLHSDSQFGVNISGTSHLLTGDGATFTYSSGDSSTGLVQGNLTFSLYPDSGEAFDSILNNLDGPLVGTITSGSSTLATFELDPTPILVAQNLSTSGEIKYMFTVNPKLQGTALADINLQNMVAEFDPTIGQDISLTPYLVTNPDGSYTLDYTPPAGTIPSGDLKIGGDTFNSDYGIAQLASDGQDVTPTFYTALLPAIPIGAVPEPGNIALLAALLTGGAVVTLRRRVRRA